MTQYEMPMEEQIKLLVKTVGALDEKFDAIDKRFDSLDKKFDDKVDAVEKKFVAMDQKLDTKFGEVMIRLDETKAIAKLGLEGLQGLRESMDDKFEAAARTSADQTDMLKAVLVHVRKRVEVLERPKPPRRRS